ncbi:hypothetical protein C6497_00665 [Candidatus Poribacteria bacterium]|nr:MAG: hypothetical protein C6497_00665 [Candidatus Poribacteria bacterium]
MLGERLKRFRLARGMTITQLCAAIDHLVSNTSLSKYERGIAQPSVKVLNRIAATYGIKSAQLWGEPTCKVESIAFRKRSKLGVREENQIKAFVAEEVEKRVWLLEQFPEQNTFDLPIRGIKINKLIDTEEAAYKLRKTLNLGIDPIGNLTSVLEDQGVFIIEVKASEGFDGISSIVNYDDKNHTTVAIAIRAGIPADSQRLTLTHEVGHLILDIQDGVDHEKVANRFGAAFLAPADQFHKDVGKKRNNVKIEELCYLKEKYGMSIQAILYRLKDLRIITNSYYKEWCISINKLGWKKHEPVELQPEKPYRFHQQICYALSENLITKKESTYLFNQTGQTSPEITDNIRYRFLEKTKKERDRILSKQAKEMSEFYENDIEWREWEGAFIESENS